MSFTPASSAQTAAIGSSAVAISAIITNGPIFTTMNSLVICVNAGATVNILWDGSAPTSTFGYPIPIGGFVQIDNQLDCQRVKLISTGSSATVTVIPGS